MTATRRALLLAAFLSAGISSVMVWGEYADVVINEKAEREGMPPVVYPHWFHRIRFQCSVCHVDLGFKTKAGANGITMDKISQGRFCGACHNGEIAWSVENCDLCHSGLPGLETGVQGGHETSGPGYY